MEFIYKRAWDYPKAWENEMNIRKLEQIINDCKIKIVEAETAIKDLQEKKSVERWRAGNDVKYYYLTHQGAIHSTTDISIIEDDYHYNTGNYFKTEQEAEDYKRRLLIEQQIKDIALQLNDGKEIDYFDNCQIKYCFYFNTILNEFTLSMFKAHKYSDICSLSDKFLETVLDEVGEEDLKFYYGVE